MKRYLHERGGREKYKKEAHRTGIPNGLKKAKSDKLWALAELSSLALIKRMEDENIISLENVDVPGSPDAMGKAALEEAAKMALGPVDRRSKLIAIQTVLQYTMAKPASKSEVKVDNAEDWLKAAIAENDAFRASISERQH